MPTREEYQAQAQAMGWPELRALWNQIKIRDTPKWAPGKAFEYLVLRAFDIHGADVRWPYPVSLYGQSEIIEEIDGSVRVDGLYSLIESKDEDGNIAIAPIAKLRNQLLRRPAGTFGMVFSSHGYTEAALQLAQFALPQAILLWTDRGRVRSRQRAYLRSVREEVSRVRRLRNGGFRYQHGSFPMNAFLVVKDIADVKLVTSLLPPEIQRQITVVAAGDRSNLTSVARTLLVTKRKPLAVLVNAGPVDGNSALGLRRETEELLRAVSGGVPFKVFMMMPEIEAMLFTVSGGC